METSSPEYNMVRALFTSSLEHTVAHIGRLGYVDLPALYYNAMRHRKYKMSDTPLLPCSSRYDQITTTTTTTTTIHNTQLHHLTTAFVRAITLTT